MACACSSRDSWCTSSIRSWGPDSCTSPKVGSCSWSPSPSSAPPPGSRSLPRSSGRHAGRSPMRSPNLRAWMPGLVLLAGCLLLFQGTREQAPVPLAAPLNQVMAQVDGYSIQDQHISDEERKVAGMSDYVARVYRRDTTIAFTTYVGYYDQQMQGKSIHSPRNCLPGAGWEIVEGRTATV